MQFDKWPDIDRVAWVEATKTGDLIDENGPASHWKTSTRKKVRAAYGRWLTFLSLTGRMNAKCPPAGRCTESNLRAYVEMLQSQVSMKTVAGRLIDLEQAVRVMGENDNRTLLNTVARNLAARSVPSRNKREKYVHPRRLFCLGIDLMDKVLNDKGHVGPRKASRYRDGLLFAMLATTLLRRSNLAHLVLGQHIQINVNIYRLVFAAAETKGGRPFEVSLPEALSPYIDTYLTRFRLLLLRNYRSDQFFITFIGTDFTGDNVYDRIRTVSLREFGIKLNPHAFRDGAATALAIEDPKHVLAATAILDHKDPKCTERYYNQARTIDSARQFQANLINIRKRIATSPKANQLHRRD